MERYCPNCDSLRKELYDSTACERELARHITDLCQTIQRLEDRLEAHVEENNGGHNADETR